MKLLYKFALLTLIVFFQFSPIQGALPKPSWQSGKLILWDRTSLEGDLSYNWLLETILFRHADGRVRTFSASQVSQFGWFDFSIHAYRDFKVLTSNEPQNGTDHAFFEICQDGSLAVVRRLKQPHGLRKYAFTHPAYYADQPAMAQNTDFFDYFVYDAGRLRAVDRFYAEIYTPLMTTYDKQLKRYVELHNINDRTLLGRLMLIDRYNSMVELDAKTASAKVLGISPE